MELLFSFFDLGIVFCIPIRKEKIIIYTFWFFIDFMKVYTLTFEPSQLFISLLFICLFSSKALLSLDPPPTHYNLLPPYWNPLLLCYIVKEEKYKERFYKMTYELRHGWWLIVMDGVRAFGEYNMVELRSMCVFVVQASATGWISFYCYMGNTFILVSFFFLKNYFIASIYQEQ